MKMSFQNCKKNEKKGCWTLKRKLIQLTLSKKSEVKESNFKNGNVTRIKESICYQSMDDRIRLGSRFGVIKVIDDGNEIISSIKKTISKNNEKYISMVIP